MAEKIRKNELDCLNRVKDGFSRRGKIKLIFDNSERSTMSSILTSAHQNENHSEFPDFFFDGGIIEHFEVTASNETGKGSKYKVDNANWKRESNKYFNKLDREYMETPFNPGTLKTEYIENVYDDFSYDSFVRSFKKNAEHHLISLKNSDYTGQSVVFMIEQNDGSLGVYINDRFVRFYSLTEDKRLLQYIKGALKDVDYIFFCTIERCEIIDLSKIDSVIAEAKDNLDIRGGRTDDIALKLYIDLPML